MIMGWVAAEGSLVGDGLQIEQKQRENLTRLKSWIIDLKLAEG